MINAKDKQIAGSAGIVKGTYSSRSQYISITEILSEGPVEGLVNGNGSVYLNDEPVSYDQGTQLQSSTVSKISATLTSGSTSVVLSSALGSAPEDTYKLLVFRNLKTTNVTLVSAVADSDNTGIQLSTSSSFFASWMVPPPFATDSRARLKYTKSDGSSDYLEGKISAVTNSTNAVFSLLGQTSTSISTILDEVSTATLFVDWASTTVSSGISTTITIALAAPTSGTAFIDSSIPAFIPQVRLPATENITKYDTMVQFRAGNKEQLPMTNIAGGDGAVLLPGSLPGQTALEKIDSQSPPGEIAAAAPTMRGTSSAGFNLSAAQAKEVDEVRILVTYNAMVNVDSGSGDESGAGARYQIDLKLWRGLETSTVTLTANRTHSGLSKSPIIFEEIINLEPFKPFDDFEITMTRLTRHSGGGVGTSGYDMSTDADKYKLTAPARITGLSSIIKEPLTYPFTSYANVVFSSKEFANMPTRSYHMRGMKVKVPSNYTTREQNGTNQATYAGLWDGTFKADKVYTDNPAWIFYDLMTNNRYGLGAFLKEYDIDKYALYRIAKYCDELVDDFKGGLEPRYRCNVYLQKAADAYKVLKDFATSFLGMLYWMDGKVTAVSDTPREPVYTFSKANVINGQFNYETTGSKTRANQVIVTWVNPVNNYKAEALIVEDKENIVKTGRVITQEAYAFGATSESQAIRYARWKLYTAVNQTEIVSFKTAMNAAFLSPGDVIRLQDADLFSLVYSGRVSTATTSTTNTLELDRGITLNPGSTYEVSVLVEGTDSINEGEEASTNTEVETRTVVTSAGSDIRSIAVSPAFSKVPKGNAIWALKEEVPEGVVSGTAKDYVIMGIGEDSINEYSVTAVEYKQEKYSAIETDWTLVEADTVYPPVDPTEQPPSPANIYIKSLSDYNRGGDEFKVVWGAPLVNGSPYANLSGYQIVHNIPGYESPLSVPATQTSYLFENVPDGLYRIAVRTRNYLNNISATKSITYQVEDVFAARCAREKEGVPVGGTVGTALELTDSYVLQFKSDTVVLSPAASPTRIYTNNETPTLSTINSAIENGSYFVLFDYSEGTLLPIRHIIDEDLGVSYWYNNLEPAFTSMTGAVSVAAGSTKVTSTNSLFLSDYRAGDIIRFGTTKAAKVVYVEGDHVLYIDRSFDTSTNGVAHYRPNIQVDFRFDTIVAEVTKTNATSTFKSFMSVDSTIAPQAVRVINIYRKNGDTFAENSNTFGSFDTPIDSANATNWSTTIPALATGDTLYVSSRTFTNDGLAPQESTWSTPVIFSRYIVGNSPTAVSLSASKQAFAYYATNTIKDNAETSTITAVMANGPVDASGTPVTVYYNFLKGSTSLQNTASNTYTYTPQSSYTNMPESITVQVLEGSSTGGVLATDTLTLHGLKDVQNNIAVVLSNEIHVIPASSSGIVPSGGYGGSGTTISVYDGATPLDFDGIGTSNGRWKVTATATNVTLPASPISESGNDATIADITAMSDNSGYITYTITGKTFSGESISTTVRQSFSKTSDGYTPKYGEDYLDGSAGTFRSFVYTTTDPGTTAPTGGTFDGSAETMPTQTGVTWTANPSGNGFEKEWISTAIYTPTDTYTNGVKSTTWANSGWSTPSLFTNPGLTSMLYEWSGSVSWPVNTTIANALVHTFNSSFGGNVRVRVRAVDAEGGFRVSLNDGAAIAMTGPDNADKWYELTFDNLLEGSNTLKFWSSNADGGTLKEIKVAFVGATGSTGSPGLTGFLYYLSGDASTDAAHITASNPAEGQIAIVQNTDGAQAGYRYNGSSWVAQDIVNTDIIFANAIKSDQLHISNSDGSTSGIFMDGTNSRIDIYDGNTLRVRLGNLATS